MIPYGHQSISREDIDSVINVLNSDWLTQGPMVEKFEEAIADYCGAKYALAVNSATSGLHLACQAIDLGPGDVVWTSPNTFVASANCARYCGADIDFVDIDDTTLNININILKNKLEQALLKDKVPKAVVAVHFSGMSCEMHELSALSKKYGFYLIEDASHAIGGTYQSERIGSCRWSDMVVFSFHPVKLITTGEGGMVLTNDQTLYKRMALLRSHGVTRDPELMTNKAEEGDWYYEQKELGYNYRMNDIEAALGLSQLSRLDEFVERRGYLAERYNQAFSGLPLILPVSKQGSRSAWHLYVVRLKLDQVHRTRQEVFNKLREFGIGVNVHYIPVHLQPYYQKLGFRQGDFPNSENYYMAAITLPLYPSLKESEQDYVISRLREVLQ